MCLPLMFQDTAWPVGTLGHYICASLFCQSIWKIPVHWEEAGEGQHLHLEEHLWDIKPPGSVSAGKKTHAQVLIQLATVK